MAPPPQPSSTSHRVSISAHDQAQGSVPRNSNPTTQSTSTTRGHERRLSTSHACPNLRQRAAQDAVPVATSTLHSHKGTIPRSCYDHADDMEIDGLSSSPNTPQIEAWLKTFRPSGGEHAELCMRGANARPPITVDSLKELDISHIAVNAKLRHDINFERELHFRPNLDGSRGKLKQQTARDYWTAVEAELELYAFMQLDPHGEKFRGTQLWAEHFRSAQRRVPVMLEAIRDVTVSLVPDTEREHIHEVIDVDLIKQQIQKGVFDLGAVAQWFGSLLKGHCAPMRDQWVDRMLGRMQRCDAGREAQTIVETMKDLFGILEVMRLDVANHQIRYCRPSLLETTYDFESQYFQRKFQNRQLCLDAARTWYDDSVETYCSKQQLDVELGQHRFAGFTTSWLKSIWCTSQRPPETFKLDGERITTLREEFRNLMFKHICWILFTMIVQEIEPTLDSTQSTIELVFSQVGTIVGHSPNATQWNDCRGNIAAELVRMALDFVERRGGKPQLSLGEMVDGAENWLSRSLTTSSEPYRQGAAALGKTMTDLVIQASGDLLAATPSEIFDALSDPPKRGADQAWVEKYFARSRKAPACLEKTGHCRRTLQIVRRLTHINVLHWRVFAPMVYEADEATLRLVAEGPNRPVSTASLESSMFALSYSDKRASCSTTSSTRSTSPK